MRRNICITAVMLLACYNCAQAAPKEHQPNKSDSSSQRKKASTSWYQAERPIYQQYNDPGIAEALNWQADNNDFCQGNYIIPKSVSSTPNPPPAQTMAVKITSSGPITFLNSGTAHATGNVVATQPGRMAEADQAFIYYDAEHNIKRIDLIGHARLQNSKTLIAGTKIVWDIKQGTAWTKDSVYRLQRGTQQSWGSARAIQNLPMKITNLWHASYTTCNPKHPAWRISAAKLHLDKTTGMGTATAAALYFKKVPLFFFPYYRFPIDNNRHSGFLAPSFSYSKEYGASLAWPFYWNIAPNFDSTITPAWIAKNGFKIDNDLRYLTYNAAGNIDFGFVPYDLNATNMQNDLNKNFAGTTYSGSINNLKHQRWMLSTDNHITFNKYWNARINASRVSDDYYLQTFSDLPDIISANTLPENADVYYNSSHWHWHGAVNYAQPLYPSNNTSGVSSYNYARLPELAGRTSYPYFAKNLGFSADWQGVYFDNISRFPAQTNIYPTADGARWHIRPGLSLPMHFASTTVDPQIWWDSTAYNITSSSHFKDSTRNLPIIDINNSAYFSSDWQFFNMPLLQTFEPELFYLYVPYKNQDNIPNFDSSANPFSYGNLIGLNSYTGYDRIQNANQLSIGFNSSTFNADTGYMRANFGLGLVRYFADRKVGLDSSYIPDDSKYSPLAAELTAYLTNRLSLTANGGWSLNPPSGITAQQNQTGLSNASATLNYNDGNNNIFSTSYNYIPNGYHNPNTGQFDNFQDVTVGGAININDHWSSMAYLDYNIGRKLSNDYFAGVTYNSCCWQLSTVYVTSLRTDTVTVRKYQHTIYFQLVLKGLGGLGANMTTKLGAYIPGYNSERIGEQLQ